MTLAEGRGLSELSLREPKGWPEVVSVFTWAGIQGSDYSYRCNLSHHWQRTQPKLKALMSVSLAAKHWGKKDGIRTSSEPGDNSGSRKRYRHARFPSLASVLDSRALGLGHSKCTEAQKEVAQGAQVIHTGVVSSGVVMGVQELFNFTPLPKSKSQIFTGDT